MKRELLLAKLVKEELRRNEELYISLMKDLGNLPEGSLLDRNGHIYRAYREGGRQHQNSIKDDVNLVQGLKLRHYLKTALPILEKRIKACEQFLRYEQLYDPTAIEQNLKPVYHGLCGSPIFLEGDISVEEWKREKYFRNPSSFEENHFTDAGMQVRSKAEAMIGTQAEHRGMLFRCEPRIEIDGEIFYPDFEFFLPNTRQRIYVEHFGKMGDLKYVKRTMYKLQQYFKAGLILGVNFFFTWETQDKPLNIKEINDMLDEVMKRDVV